MDRQDIHAPDPQGFIPFIHNYCDRRCERCRFMRQCRVGALEADDAGPDGEPASERPGDLRERMRVLMGLSNEEMDELEKEEVEQEEDDPDNGDASPSLGSMNEPEDADMEEYRRERAEQDRQLEAHPLTALTQEYMDLVHDWIEARSEALTARGIELHPRHGMGIAVGLRTAEAQAASEAVQWVIWDHTMLHVKGQRALHGLLDDGPALTGEDLQSDHNGSAKLCIELAYRSRMAWNIIRDHLPEEAALVGPVGDLLERIGQALHRAFPHADAFIRPGFDAPRQPR